jgi:hypothetical protein
MDTTMAFLILRPLTLICISLYSLTLKVVGIRVVGFAFKTDLDTLTALVPQVASVHLPPSKIVDLYCGVS